MSDHVDDDDTGVVTVEDLRALRRQRDEARKTADDANQARARAERERDEARGSAGNETKARFDAEDAALDSQIVATEAAAEAMTERIAQLNAEGSFSEAAKAHRELARAEAKIENLNSRKEALAGFRAHQEEQAKRAAPQQQGNGMSQRQNAWVQQHPLFVEDSTEGRRYQARINSAHHAAVADGVQIDTDEYYDRLAEAHDAYNGGGRRQQTHDAGDAEYEAPPPRRAPSTMPVSRNTGGNTRSNGGPVRLSPDQREAADMTFPDVPVDDYVDNGITRPGRYRQYMMFQGQLKQQGRI